MTIRAVANTHAALWYLVAATALYLGVPVISRDREIRAPVVATIW